MEQSTDLSIRLNADARLVQERKALGLEEVAMTTGLITTLPEVNEGLARTDHQIAVLSLVLENAKQIVVRDSNDEEGYKQAKSFMSGLKKLNGRKDKWADAVKAEANEFRAKVIAYEKTLTNIIDKAKGFIGAEIDKYESAKALEIQEAQRKEEERFNKRLNGFISLGMERVEGPVPGVIVPGKPDMLISDDAIKLSTGASLKAMLDAFMPALEEANKRKHINNERAKDLEERGAVFGPGDVAVHGEGAERIVITKNSLYLYSNERMEELLSLEWKTVEKAPEANPFKDVSGIIDWSKAAKLKEEKMMTDAEKVREIIRVLEEIERIPLMSEIGKHGIRFFSPKVAELVAYLKKGMDSLAKELDA